MSIIYMLSGPGKNTGFPKKIRKILKKDLKGKKNIVFIPTTPNNFKRNDLYVYGDKENIIGITDYLNEFSTFENITIIDDRVPKEEVKKRINESDILYLLGGDPFSQIDYLKKQKYDRLIKKYCGIVIGTSAGAMNLAKEVYCSKDEDFDESIFYKGLGMVDITIDPHFDINNEEQVNEIKINSKKRRIIGLPNDSAIIISNNEVKYIGNIYFFENGELNN